MDRCVGVGSWVDGIIVRVAMKVSTDRVKRKLCASTYIGGAAVVLPLVLAVLRFNHNNAHCPTSP